MSLLRSCIIFFSFILLLSESAYAQSFNLSTYQMEQGLPSNLTKTVFQDKEGFIWVGTDVGLLRYDGNNFLHLNNKLASQYIKSFFKTKAGDLLVIHDMGIDKVINNLDTVYFSNFIHGRDVITDSTISYPKNIYEDSSDALWISEGQSIVKFKDGRLKRYSFDAKNKTTSFSKSFQFVEDGMGNFLVFSQQGYLYVYDKKTDDFKELKLKATFSGISDIIKIEQGKLWIADERGISEITIKPHGEITSINKILVLGGVSTFKRDPKTDIVYIGTWRDGVYKLSVNESNRHLEKLDILKYKVINNFYINPNGDIWISCDEGLALLYISFFAKVNIDTERNYIGGLNSLKDGKIHITNGSAIKEIKIENDVPNAKELFLMRDNELILTSVLRNGILYFGSNNGTLYRFDLKTKKITKSDLSRFGTSLYYFELDKNNNIWICQQDSKILVRVAPDDKLAFYGDEKGIKSRVFVVKQTANGIYCGGAGKDTYLYKYDAIKNNFINVSPELPFDARQTFEVQDLCYTPKNELYLASNNNGLLRVIKDSRIEKIDLMQKQEVTNIKALVLGSNGGLWIGTDMGLIQYIDEQFLLFDEFNGLPSTTISYRCLAIDSEKHVWVGSANGLAYMQKWSHEIKKTPTPMLLSLKMNGNKFVLSDNKQKNSFENNSFLEASFTALIYPSKNITYQYRIVGLKDNWISLNHNDLTIPQLTTGTYTLEIRASKQGEYLWSDPLTINFNIKLPWYLNWWAFLLFASGFIFIIWLIAELNSIRLKKEKQRLESIIQIRTAEIVNQKEEITIQRDAIEKQRDSIEEKSNELENALDEIKALNATKDRFFSIVAHDLRGPLNSLSAFSNLLIEHTDSLTKNDIQKVGTQLNKEVKNTIALTENLLTWARSQMKQASFKPVIFSLNNVINQNIILLTAPAQNKDIELIATLPAEITVEADIDHVNFIIRNLISNALKFTFPGGSIKVHASINEHMAQISIIDTGVGMSPQVSQKIFNIDSNHSTKGTGGEKGTGLGLVLCADFVKINGGTIWVESEVNQGSVFYFTLKTPRTEH